MYRGRPIVPALFDSDFNLYILGSYVSSYFFLMAALTMIIFLSNTKPEKCDKKISKWLEISCVFYYIANIVTLSVFISTRRDLPQVRSINLGLVICLFLGHRK